MKKTMVSLLIATAIPFINGMPIVKTPGDAKVPVAPSEALGKIETIRGNLVTVIKEQRLIVLKAKGVPFNFKVTTATKNRNRGNRATFEDLANLTDVNLSVTFVPMREGNYARNIQVEQ